MSDEPPWTPEEPERPLTRATSLKSKLYRLWNNAVNTQYFRPNYSPTEPIWVLGVRYAPGMTPRPMFRRSSSMTKDGNPPPSPSATSVAAAAAAAATAADETRATRAGSSPLPASDPCDDLCDDLDAAFLDLRGGAPWTTATGDAMHVREALRDVHSRPWFTYREGFECILASEYTSDVGWGCMLRCGQMLLAHTLLVLTFGREWRVSGLAPRPPRPAAAGYGAHSALPPPPSPPPPPHQPIVRLFDDKFANHCPFSLHHLLRHVASDGVAPGDWLGPTAICRALCRAVNERSAALEAFPPLKAYHATDGLVSRAEVASLLAAGPSAVLVLVPLRLGIKEISEVYYTPLRKVFESPLCVGILGGRPRQSLYFVGYQEDKLLGLDPHICRLALDLHNPATPLISFHCTSPRKLPLNGVDPSMALGFLCRNEADFAAFTAYAASLAAERHPLFTLV